MSTQHPHTEVFSQWNGKPGKECNIQYRQHPDPKWYDFTDGEPSWSFYIDYRVKPTPALRPWNYDELKEFFFSGKCIYHRDGAWYRPTKLTKSGRLVTGRCDLSAECLLDEFTQQDGSPCGVME